MYEPTEWKKGDVVTSAKLNKLEQGVANAGVLIANVIVTGEDPDLTITLDKTWQEIADADFCVIRSTEEISEETNYAVFDCVERVGTESGTYIVAGLSGNGFATDSPNGYPVYNDGTP